MKLKITMVDYLNVSGMSGVYWDTVELPSQFMEKTVLVGDKIPTGNVNTKREYTDYELKFARENSQTQSIETEIE